MVCAWSTDKWARENKHDIFKKKKVALIATWASPSGLSNKWLNENPKLSVGHASFDSGV